MTDRPRADVEEMVRRLQYFLWNETLLKDAAVLLSQEHARVEKAEATVEALRISEATLNRALASEVELRNKVYIERVEKAEARAEQLERQLAEADAVIALLDSGNSGWRFGTSDETVLNLNEWEHAAKARHASRASPKP